jgi:hypothetical protein
MTSLQIGVLGAMLLAAGAASAAPGVEIENAAAVVTIIPENRADVSVAMAQTNRRLPITVTRTGDLTRIEGNLRFRSANCHRGVGGQRVWAFGVGDFARKDLPVVVIRTPMDARIEAGGAVFGAVGRAGSLMLSNSGCGDWTVANVAGPLVVHAAGSGDVRAGEAASADIAVTGSSDVSTHALRGGLRARVTGSGDLSVASVSGALDAHVAGSGDVIVHGGEASTMTVGITGSGNVRFGGVAQSLDASVAGSGDVTVRKVVGPVSRHVAGSGDITVGT